MGRENISRSNAMETSTQVRKLNRFIVASFMKTGVFLFELKDGAIVRLWVRAAAYLQTLSCWPR